MSAFIEYPDKKLRSVNIKRSTALGPSRQIAHISLADVFASDFLFGWQQYARRIKYPPFLLVSFQQLRKYHWTLSAVFWERKEQHLNHFLELLIEFRNWHVWCLEFLKSELSNLSSSSFATTEHTLDLSLAILSPSGSEQVDTPRHDTIIYIPWES